VRGSESRLVRAAGADELTELVPHAEVVEIQGAGHMVTGQDNSAFCPDLLRFLTHHRAGG
jgi:pimeloyl-ACP methyl ester carboxylesterase